MRFSFQDKTVLIVSNVEWSDFQVSKHHYAATLSTICKKVYYLSPPLLTGRNKIALSAIDGQNNLIEVKVELAVPQLVRFQFYKLYVLYVKRVMRKLKKALDDIDLVWSFEHVKYPEIEVFNAPLNIYHPVDQLDDENEMRFANKNDIVLSCSYDVLEKLKDCKPPKHFINHGLATPYANIKPRTLNDAKIKVGFVGNLIVPQIDYHTFTTIIKSHPDLNFYFYGKSDVSDSTPDVMKNFVTLIRNSDNCKLMGVVNPTELAGEINTMDIMILCYDMNVMSRGNNSHKILEYLSTGKPIVSNYIGLYEGSGLLEMLESTDNSKYVELFDNTILNLRALQSESESEKRRSFALDNTYKKQIKRIEQHLNDLQ
ncbi:MAG: hypothetical protein JKX76_03845 [Colwellia sp.]|nr:hypothetical protein [Colwellia sp.]